MLINPQTTTKSAALKAEVLKIARQLLADYAEDIETGIDDGTYTKKENVKNRQFIADAEKTLNEFEKELPEVFVYVDGGVLQGASATVPLVFNLFDQDNYDAGSRDEDGQTLKGYTPETWDEMIQARTEAGEIKSVF